jgi:hypothetical protein
MGTRKGGKTEKKEERLKIKRKLTEVKRVNKCVTWKYIGKKSARGVREG